ncbi:MAG: 50S ribosomal protein L22 [Candidatus Portnoybacteria bacterium]|nr:50S ribosomal protein L22 [Candidatus Portnoybacteria bacterium]
MITAKLRHLRISPRKVRLVTNLIKGLSIKEAEKQLKFLTKKSAQPILKLLNSAVANAENNAKLIKENLYISRITVDIGPSLKRWRPRAMGRAFQILKRTSHITITLDQKETLVSKKEKKVKEPVIKKQKKESVIKEETIEKKVKEKTISKKRSIPPKKPYGATTQSKKRFFSRQTLGNAKKLFRRKSI